VLLVARKRSVLKAWQQAFRPETKSTVKRYLVMVDGPWPSRVQRVQDPLLRYETDTGERRVRVDDSGKPSHTEFAVLKGGKQCTLLQATLKTGRTHQIRVHAASRGHPVLGDNKYGGAGSDARSQALGVARLALHAAQLSVNNAELSASFVAPLPADLRPLFERVGYTP
jgi:23S rRNA pseudouridine955/2504/2580 synthase